MDRIPTLNLAREMDSISTSTGNAENSGAPGNTVRGVAALLGAVAAAIVVPIGTGPPFLTRPGLKLIASFGGLFIATMAVSALAFVAVYPLGGVAGATFAAELASAIGIYAIGALTGTMVITAFKPSGANGHTPTGR
jgi:hypothetical protein